MADEEALRSNGSFPSEGQGAVIFLNQFQKTKQNLMRASEIDQR